MPPYNRLEIKLNSKPKDKTKPKHIAKMSAKRKELQKEYKQAVKAIIKEDTVCKIGAPGCTQKPSGLHHLQKRSPANLTKVSNLIPCCSSCNLWVEENSAAAIAKGFSISRFKK